MRTVHKPARSFAGPTKMTTSTVTITVANKHVFDVAGLVVRDTVPLGNEDAKINLVILRPPDGLALAKVDEEVVVAPEDPDDVKDDKSTRPTTTNLLRRIRNTRALSYGV